ncbi:MAG: alpha-amylase [Chlorobi bacterium]|nr:alpha-amylase [Chlorobiota bacterium]
MQLSNTLTKLWKTLYPQEPEELLQGFLQEVEATKQEIHFPSHNSEWYKDAVVYSLYVDLFNVNFNGLKEKLDYLQELGVNCLWLLPILDSPMKDAGFDIRDYKNIRADLLGLPNNSPEEEKRKVFRDFLEEAHDRGIKVIFDIALNHTSEEHQWFREAKKSKGNPFRDYYIWSDNTDLYKEARIIFYGLCESNWQKEGDEYFFHRFFEFQPDLNYKNPKVLLEMIRNFLFWLTQGVDGFRADAIPYIWKEEGTDCENLPQTHAVVKFFRAVLDHVRPGTLLLAEACQKPKEVVKYFGDSDECNAGYHFPLMPQMFKAISAESAKPITKTLSLKVTPAIPESAQWFTFLRCHDELSLELVYVSEEDRKYIHENYCLKPQWDFRLGQGVAARLSELMQRDPKKIALAYSIMLTLPGTPIIYYGDEFGKLNDEAYYKEMIKHTGKDDTRFLVRGKIDWKEVEKSLSDGNSFSSKVYSSIKNMVNTRNKFKCFGRGSIEWLDLKDKDGNNLKEILAYLRIYQNEKVMVVHNLSEKDITIDINNVNNMDENDLLGNIIENKNKTMNLEGHGYFWIDTSNQ